MKIRPDHNPRGTEGRYRLKGFLLGLGVAMPSVWISMDQKRLWLWTLPLSMVLFIMAVVAPHRLSCFFEFVEWFHKKIGRIVTFIGFIAIITPMAWLLRFVRGDTMPLQFKHKCRSYWLLTPNDSGTVDIDFNKQF